MAIVSAAGSFLHLVVGLQSMPLFCLYLLMISLSGLWQRKVPALSGLRPLLVVHNFACCLASVCSLGGFAYGVWRSGSLYGRQTSDSLTWFFTLYWMTKVLELLDTVFMVLRHKSRQISFLHVYHHSSMLLLSDLSRRFYPWPAIAVFLGMNSFVHVVLYLYYGLSALFPDNPPTWKKQMTQVQIAQFLVGFVLAVFGYLYHSFCVYSIFYGLTMTYLFSNFYYHAYVKKSRSKEAKEVLNKKGD
ncbi:very long chain fatty acid elongase 2-like [Babylonia areolata]|uniref:very long chain fatty acid elongase 2-like n=1 Tax=Babylonia areolata TaxID=304850 RepID=UPI003FD409B1